jgi:hypothetical protein
MSNSQTDRKISGSSKASQTNFSSKERETQKEKDGWLRKHEINAFPEPSIITASLKTQKNRGNSSTNQIISKFVSSQP